MDTRKLLLLVTLCLGLLVGGALVFRGKGLQGLDPGDLFGDTETIERTDYRRPPPKPADDGLADDRVEDKVPAFDPALVDRRPLGEWSVNASAAVTRLDTPMLRPDLDEPLLRLHPSYKAAISALPDGQRKTVLPSVNQIDGKAKQFDDGLYAAIDLAYYRGLDKTLVGHVDLVRRLLAKVGPASPAAPYLAAGLTLAGDDPKVEDRAKRDAWVSGFEADTARSKPIAFYTWSKPLSDCFRFLRFFQAPFGESDRPAAAAIAEVLKADAALLADYDKALAFYAKLSNPTVDASLADLARGRVALDTEKDLSLFPASTSREAELFTRLFPLGLPPDADLMRALITRVRSGDVSLTPKPDGGWYDHQVHALEVLLLPSRGEGADNLLLTRAYKERMLEAFKALITKRKETHVRGAKTAAAPSSEARMPKEVAPRLRLEPCPSYYVRTARAYAFLSTFLESSVGEAAMKSLHGLREGGERPTDLHAELKSMRDLFYGCYLLSAEDIGLKPAFLDGEPIDRPACERAASDWLAKSADDPDMAVDTRVSVPVFLDGVNRRTKLWATLGVRLAKLDASYARGPRLRTGEASDWREVEAYKLAAAHYLIAIDEFAEVELAGLRSLTRAELRHACDVGKTKEGIVEALAGPAR